MLQQFHHVADALVEVDRLKLGLRLAAEPKQLLNELRSILSGLFSLAQTAEGLVSRAEFHQRQTDVAQHDCQQVVEIVRDAAG